MNAIMSRGDFEAKQKFEKKENERKKNLLVLIDKYLQSIGYSETSLKLEDESNLDLEQYDLADNIDLYIIMREYEEYYYMKFGKAPKFSTKISEGKVGGGVLPRINNNTNNAVTGRKTKSGAGVKKANTNVVANQKQQNPMNGAVVKGNQINDVNGNGKLFEIRTFY